MLQLPQMGGDSIIFARVSFCEGKSNDRERESERERVSVVIERKKKALSSSRGKGTNRVVVLLFCDMKIHLIQTGTYVVKRLYISGLYHPILI